MASRRGKPNWGMRVLAVVLVLLFLGTALASFMRA